MKKYDHTHPDWDNLDALLEIYHAMETDLDRVARRIEELDPLIPEEYQGYDEV